MKDGFAEHSPADAQAAQESLASAHDMRNDVVVASVD